ncbi:immunoglobulin-binding protein 1-like [Apostichopus japonicus]|uniref:immunoglobulin-binding protein 1-like n=1 Tax=Stichopus japonicus TaxID=307972 RepID=UPI003AB4145F
MEPQKLSSVFNEAWEINEKLDSSESSTGSGEYQTQLSKCIQLLERATLMVNDLSLFSQNETAEEISTSDIRYLLLPALLGDLTMRITTDERLDTLNRAKVYWKDFIARCKCYELTEEEIPEEPSQERPLVTGPPNLRAMEANREAKIKRYKEKKDIEKKMQVIGTLKYITTKDEETQREYYLLLLKSWINKGLEELPGLYQEAEMLEFMAKRRERGEENEPTAAVEPARKPLKPFVLLRDKLQAHVFGAGYPSLPTMTLEEYFQKEIDEGKIQLDSRNPGPQEEAEEKEAAEVKKELEVETDDRAALQKAREWDDWKDDHKTGWGNRDNMG